jgi:hypothetical protein
MAHDRELFEFMFPYHHKDEMKDLQGTGTPLTIGKFGCLLSIMPFRETVIQQFPIF